MQVYSHFWYKYVLTIASLAMSLYARNAVPNEDDRPRSFRRTRGSRSKETDCDLNLNTSSNLVVENDNESFAKVNLEVEKSRKLSGSRSPAPRRKSALIETMTANFERKNSNDKAVASGKPLYNGDKPSPYSPSTPSSNTKSDTEESPIATQKKTGPSARRGKQQREKRMLRQKRRSTGVVNLKDVENNDENENKVEKADKTNDSVNVETETDLNTHNNELSPVQGFCSVSRVIVKSETRSSNETTDVNGSTYDQVLTAAVVVPHINSSRKHNSRFKEMSHRNSGSDELQKKLDSAEIAISKLHAELKSMDNELRSLEEENHKLRQENKMLEDENMTMIRLIRKS